jgi:hypothetical protein
MPDFYVRSTDGSDSDNGSTWALAKATLAGACAAASFGDTIYVSHVHSEAQASTMTVTCPGTIASPCRILCVNDGTMTAATTAVIGTTGANTMSLQGSFYCQGIQFECGTTAQQATFNLANISGTAEYQRYKDCAFRLPGTAAGGSNIAIGHNSQTTGERVLWENCTYRQSSAGSRIIPISAFRWNGGSVESGSSTPTTSGLFLQNTTSRGVGVVMSGVDLSAFSSSLPICSNTFMGEVTLRNCKLPAGWGEALFVGTTTGTQSPVRLHNCDAGNVHYSFWERDYYGVVKAETSIVRTGGASDGTTAMSWKVTTSPEASELSPFDCPEILIWNDATGSALTVTLEYMQDSGAGTLTNAQIWMDVQYQGTSGAPLSLFGSSGRANLLASATTNTSSSEAWPNGTTPTRQKCEFSITPQEKGWVIVRPRVGVASTTVYICPKLTAA